MGGGGGGGRVESQCLTNAVAHSVDIYIFYAVIHLHLHV